MGFMGVLLKYIFLIVTLLFSVFLHVEIARIWQKRDNALCMDLQRVNIVIRTNYA